MDSELQSFVADKTRYHTLRLTSLLHLSRANRWLLYGLLLVAGAITALRVDPMIARLLREIVPAADNNNNNNNTVYTHEHTDNEPLQLTMCLLSVTMVTVSCNLLQEAFSLTRPHIRINFGAVAVLGWLLVYDMSNRVVQLAVGTVLLLVQCPADSLWRLLPHIYAEHAPEIHLWGTLLPHLIALISFTLVGTERMFSTFASQITFLLATTLMCGCLYWSNDRIAPAGTGAANPTDQTTTTTTAVATTTTTVNGAPTSTNAYNFDGDTSCCWRARAIPTIPTAREYFDRRTAAALATNRSFNTNLQRPVKSTLAILYFNALLLTVSCTLDRIILIVAAHTKHRFSLAYFPILATFASTILSYVCASAYHYLRTTYEESIEEADRAPPPYDTVMLSDGRVYFGAVGPESALRRQMRWFRIAWMLGGLITLIAGKLVIIWTSYGNSEAHVCVIAATLLGGGEMVRGPLLDAINRLTLSLPQRETPALYRLNGTISAVLVSCGCLMALPYVGPWILSATMSFCMLVALLLTVVGSRALDELDCAADMVVAVHSNTATVNDFSQHC